MLKILALRALAQTARLVATANQAAERAEAPQIFSQSPKEGMVPVQNVPGLYYNPHYRLNGFGYSFPYSVQYWADYYEGETKIYAIRVIHRMA